MSNKILGLSLFAAAFTALVVLSGCGPKEARAPQVAGQSSSAALRYFPRQNTELNDVLMFMWKKDASPEQVTTVLKNSRRLDLAKSEIAPKVRKRTEYKDRFAKLKYKGKEDQPDETPVDIVDYGDKLTSRKDKEDQRAAREKELKDIQEALVKYQADLEKLKKLPASEENAKQIAALNKDIEQKLSESKRKSKVIERLEKEIAASIAQAAPTAEAIKKAGLDAQVSEWLAQEKELARLRAEVTGFTVPINDSTWVFNSSPMRFSFNFTREGLTADIHNWKLSEINDPEIMEADAPVDYSSEGYRPRIKNVAYEPMGGIFTFEVYAPRSVYWFKIARTKYDREGDGRLYFKGEILRCTVENGYGWPVIEYVRDIVQCGVSTEGAPIGAIEQVGQPAIRRGAANFVDKDDLK
jgi:hypothetical protein